MKLIPILLLLHTTCASKFALKGPTLTVTLREPEDPNIEPSTTSSFASIDSLSPNLAWSIRSTEPPLPGILPSLQGIMANMSYNYQRFRRGPSEVDLVVKFGSFLGGRGDVQINPSYWIKEKVGLLRVQLGGGQGKGKGCFVMAQLSNRKPNQIVEFVKGSYRLTFPFNAIRAVEVAPTYNVNGGTGSCLISGESGSGRTAALLNLNTMNPTLSVVHMLDDNNIISPEISIYTAKILYKWDCKLGQSGNLKTTVDPTSAIEVSWIDETSNGKWVTDFKLPLVGNTPGPLGADIKVRRQFNF